MALHAGFFGQLHAFQAASSLCFRGFKFVPGRFIKTLSSGGPKYAKQGLHSVVDRSASPWVQTWRAQGTIIIVRV